MDEMTDIDLDEALRIASERAADGSRPSVASVASALRNGTAREDDPLHDVAAALEYHPADACAHVLLDPDARPASCACVASIIPSDPRVLALLARALAHAPHPLVGARFADLLWNAGYGATPREWAQRAVDAYLAAVYDEFGHPLEIAEGLQRALVLATEIEDQPRRAAVLAALVGLAVQSLQSEQRSSGVALAILETLANQPSASRPADLGALVERALDHYRDDPWLVEAALDIKARLVEPGEREQLRINQVDAFAMLARGSDGIVRHALYARAIELAQQHSLSTAADQLRSELVDPRASEPEPLDDPADDFIDRIVGDDSLGEALARFGASLPTEGYDDPREPADAKRLSYFAVLAVELLARTRQRYGSVSAAGAWLECPLIGPTIASRIAHGIELYERGEVDAAVAALAPRLEWIVRAVANAAGVGDLEHEPEIDDVLQALTGALYEPSRRYLATLLPHSTGGASAQDAALLVHAACHLRLLQPVQQGPADEPA